MDVSATGDLDVKRLAILIAILIASTPHATQVQSEGKADGSLLTKERKVEREALFDALKNSQDPATGRRIANEIWKFWMTAPGPKEQALLDLAMKKRSVFDYAGALTEIDRLIAMAPEYPEGWNQRATLLFLQRKYDESLTAIERTLQLEPKHFGSLAGQARIFMQQGRVALGQSTLRRAVEIFPWIPERDMLIEPLIRMPKTRENKS